MATLWKTDGTSQVVTPKQGTEFTLAELKAFVGGYIEIVRLDEGSLMVVNESGLLENLPLNNMGTQLYRQMAFRNTGRRCDDPVVGDVLVCSRTEVT
ncbi:MAG TPA: DUF3846 domain-containing protein [Tepidisphaeraceae bacterium]|jgi:hypothetical protein|nr:DUF3846 domain-containing protein [Tepidisphaeraceae bacterium]